MGDHVFLSYARADEAYADKLVAHLRAQGVEMWSDAAISFGHRWTKEIEEKIDSCAAFVVVMSPAADESEWVGLEVQHAREQGKRVFPLLLSGRTLFMVSHLQHEDVRHGGMPSQQWVDGLRAAAAGSACGPAQAGSGMQLPARPAGPRARVTLTGHTGWVHSVAFSPDGRTLATGSGNKTVRLWEVATGQQTATLRIKGLIPFNFVASVAFSPDGRTLATGDSYGMARLWEMATGGQSAVLGSHTGWVHAVAFSPDGRTVATGDSEGTARLWDVATGGQAATLRIKPKDSSVAFDWVRSVAFSPDGRTLAAVSGNKTVRLWAVVSGQQMAALAGHTGRVYSVAFSPDGCTLATGGGDKMVRLWAVVSGQQIAALTGHTGGVRSVAFSPDGRTLATGSHDTTVQLWDVG